jgi:hypothetical protein
MISHDVYSASFISSASVKLGNRKRIKRGHVLHILQVVEKYLYSPKEMADAESEEDSIPWYVILAAIAGILSFYGYGITP